MGKIGGKWCRLAEEQGSLIRRRKALLKTSFRLTSKHAEELAAIEVRLLEIKNEQATRGGPGSSRWKKRQERSGAVPSSVAQQLSIPVPSELVPENIARELIINQPDQTPATQEEVPNE